MALTDAQIQQVAAEYSIPPAILLGVVRSQGASPTFNMPEATLGAYGLSADAVTADPMLALTIAARTISQSFTSTGSWEGALSNYLTGDPNAWNSPTSSIGGTVLSILGQAATDPGFGMSAYQPADLTSFQAGSAAFGQHLEGLVHLGGIVSPQSVQQYHSQASQVTQSYAGGQNFQPSTDMHKVSADILTAAGLPVTDANVAVIATMAKGEGMPLGDFNWLATTQGQGASFNSVGVKIFDSYQHGIQATADTLRNGNYGSMIALMGQGADLQTIASDPGVQHNLRTWQGGSSEDVNLLTHEANVPGGSGQAQSAAGGQQQQAAPAGQKDSHHQPTQAPDPAHVGEFAAQLQGAGIDPKQFAQYFPVLAAHNRALLNGLRTDVGDYASLVQALAAQNVPMSQAAIVAHVGSQPHPTYPNISAGALNDTFNRATLYSMLHTQSVPTLAETSRLAGMTNKEVADYFAQKGEASKPAPAPAAAPAPQPQQAQAPNNPNAAASGNNTHGALQ